MTGDMNECFMSEVICLANGC